MAKVNSKKLQEESFDTNTVLENKFTNLKELVKAPLLAVAESNADLAKSIMNYIQASGQQANVYNEKVTFLENINLGYQQVRQGENNIQLIEDMALQIPLLSIMPITSLQVKKAKIDFNAEVRGIEDQEHQVVYEARVCAPQERVTDYLSKIHFEIEVESSPVSEGLARFVDVLNMHQIPKKIDTRPVDKSGSLLYGQDHKKYEEEKKLNDELKQVILTSEKIEMLIHQQKLSFDGLLKDIPDFSESNYDLFVLNNTIDFIREISKMEHSQSIDDIIHLYEEIQNNLDTLTKLTQRKQDIQNILLQNETSKVLNNEAGE